MFNLPLCGGDSQGQSFHSPDLWNSFNISKKRKSQISDQHRSSNNELRKTHFGSEKMELNKASFYHNLGRIWIPFLGCVCGANGCLNLSWEGAFWHQKQPWDLSKTQTQIQKKWLKRSCGSWGRCRDMEILILFWKIRNKRKKKKRKEEMELSVVGDKFVF